MLERLIKEDSIELADLEKEIFPSPWTAEDFEFELTQNPFAHYFCIRQNGKIVAYAGSWLSDDKAQITNVAVVKECRQQGLAFQMLSEVIDFLKLNGGKVFTLEVREHNDPAINLYRKLGFEQVAIRKNYYQETNEDAYLMMMEVE